MNISKLPVYIDEYYEIPKEYYAKLDILDIRNVHAKGVIKEGYESGIIIDLEITGVMKLKDAVTNEEINYDFSLNTRDNFEENDENLANFLKNNQNSLDIIEFLWENIVLEVPISVTKHSNMKLSGANWQLNAKEDTEQKDPRFEKLDELFKGGEK